MATDLTDRRYGVMSNVGCKAPCKGVAATNITLSGEQTVGGIALVDGDRCLVMGQTSNVNNGIYVVSTGTWERDADCDGNRDLVAGTMVPVSNTGGFTLYRCTSTASPIVIGTSAITFESVAISLTPASVATDAIWDAAGDLAVGTGANTAARLAIGTTGQALTVAGGTAAWAAVGDMILASSQSVTGLKTYDPSKIAMKGSSTGVTTFATANASATNYTITFPASTGTVMLTSGFVPPGSSGQLTFNSSGAFGADSDLSWDATNNILTIGNTGTNGTIAGAAGSGAAAGTILWLAGGAGGPTSGAGGMAFIVGGAGTATNSDGGAAKVTGGAAASGSGAGGDVVLTTGGGGARRGQIVLNGGSSLALATNATAGFVCFPTCAGTPNGTPAGVTANTVPMVYDTTGTRLWTYTGGAWKSVMDLQGTGTDVDALGFRGTPQNAQAGNYTLVAGDAGKHIYHALGDGAGDVYTIPANASVAFEVGTEVTFVNMAADAVSITITTDTMYLSGAGTTGTRTLAQYGIAKATKLTSTTWIIDGTGLT